MEVKRLKTEEKVKKKASKMMMECKDSSSSKMENKVNENAMLKDLTLVEEGSKKIEVCMRGKCKKSGAAMLMENFQRSVWWKVILMLPSFVQMLVKANNG
ncbi:hypothetical protein Tco_0963082 [Tanacetum coccineum]